MVLLLITVVTFVASTAMLSGLGILNVFVEI
jgi:bacteriorhodopsin